MKPNENGDAPSSDDAASGGGGFLAHLPTILWQRKWIVLIPFVLATLVALAAVVLLPSVYRSTALMQVQSPQLPGEVTGGNNAEIVDRRIARIRQQVTSRPDLVALIEKHGLYKSEKNRKPLSEVINDMRDAIVLTPTLADVPSARADQRTIAFELSYDYSEPGPTQAVTQELTDRILQLDATTNASQATNTVQFLSDQAKGLEEQIAAVQGQINGITARYGNVLGRTGIGVMGSNSGSYDIQIAQLQRENATLAEQRDASKMGDNRDPLVVAAEGQLAAARAVYSENHPDVQIAKQRLAQAKELSKTRQAALPYEAIDRQIAFNNSQIATLRGAKSQELSQAAASMNAQAQAPAVQQQISDLQERLSGLNDQYKTVSTRLMAAQAGVRADDQMMGERLSVVDPPVLPDSPVKPNRPLLLALGAASGLALGILAALAIELLLSPVRDPAQLAALTGEAPLCVVPLIEPRVADKSKRERPRTWWRFWQRGKALPQ
ncbi:MAG: lipopolysaccharide biosynthesis protein [Proteobacteria bacterium]|nr:lipopolysaccharide biosynthesis protein [Pseudomonadota bacterium]